MLEVGKVYIGKITRRFGDNDVRDDFKSIMWNKKEMDFGMVKTWFVENEPFLVIEFMAYIGDHHQYKILLNNEIFLLNYYIEEQTEFQLVC